MNKFKLIVIINAAWRRRYLIFLPVFIFPFVGYAIAYLAPTTYHSHTSMLIQETAKMNPFLQDIAVSTMLQERLNALGTLLKSRHIIHSVALELGLINETMTPNEIEKATKKISKSLTVTKLGENFLKIELESNKPEGMKDLLQSISNHFIEQLLSPERSSIQDSGNFFKFHINKRKLELEIAENALAKYKNNNINLIPERQTEILIRLGKLKQRLSEKQSEFSGTKKNLNTLEHQLSNTNPIVKKIEEKIIAIHSELALLRSKYTDNHSLVKMKKQELERLKSKRFKLLKTNQFIDNEQLHDPINSNKLQILRNKFESLTEEIKSLDKIILDLEQKTNNFSKNSKKLDRLVRDVKIKRQLYNELIERYEMAQLTESLGMFEQNKRVKIIDLPFTPSVPSNFPPIVFILAGGLSGFILGISLATITELLDTSIRRVEQLELLTGVPVITSIPKII
ncbi:GumC family protein [Candidatus Photodesmus anomalopis]|uniref:Chain length determinant protein n=1 Tax=Candidatus Photodesmus katoptron Akat1 TaxID=1236703 RepID=S3EGW4_9GAMM|nr:Wzz/FepE/Etk N-terminal domain-containing protein [Candidatus Photodesmus katoptron]EPE37403.1 chain length determinant protein [Candidatus Photodesmus katoptron Akat1]